MTRARIAALVLVNWKGVFYERYLLDRHVTALEGANGAGKTTVMIAAYVALLPDMSRLRFTNLGESGATGGDRGIWGRLGEPGRLRPGVRIGPDHAALRSSESWGSVRKRSIPMSSKTQRMRGFTRHTRDRPLMALTRRTEPTSTLAPKASM